MGKWTENAMNVLCYASKRIETVSSPAVQGSIRVRMPRGCHLG
jgi:hypothetical protein